MIKYEDLLKNINILLVDDDEDYIDITKMSLVGQGYNIDVVTTGAEAIDTIKQNNHQIVLLDYFIGDMTGEEVIEEVRKTNDEVIIILQTGFSGEKPPMEMMKKLKIQNYHDKADGIDRLNLQILSAIRILFQQNAIELSMFKTNAIGKLMSNISCNIKSNLVNMSAGIELTKLILSEKGLSKEEIDKVNECYYANKEDIEKIDRILSAIAKGSTDEKNDIMSDKEIIDILNLLINSDELIHKNMSFKISSSLRSKGFISGGISEILFLISEMIFEIIRLAKDGSKLEVVLTEDDSKWYFKINIDHVVNLSINNKNMYKNILNNIMSNEIIFDKKEIIVKLDK